MSWISHWTSLPSNHASEKPPLNRKHLGISRFRAEDHILSGRCCCPGRSLTHVGWTWEFNCDRMWQKKKQHEIKSNLFGKGESVERKNNLLAVEENFLPFKQTNPMTTSDVSPWRTLPGFSWIGEALLGTLWSFHPDPCKNPPNMSKFHLQVFSFESLVTKLKRDDFFGGFQNFFGHHHGVDSPISPVPDGNSPLWELPSAF